jgi:hypothetical protein
MREVPRAPPYSGFPASRPPRFPDGPEREVYPPFERGLPETLRDAVISAMEAAYTAAWRASRCVTASGSPSRWSDGPLWHCSAAAEAVLLQRAWN